jgi:hypothetical protein
MGSNPRAQLHNSQGILHRRTLIRRALEVGRYLVRGAAPEHVGSQVVSTTLPMFMRFWMKR